MDYKSKNFSYSPIKMTNYFKNGNIMQDSDHTDKYKLSDIDNPNGWSFHELETLNDMGFKIDTDHDMVIEIEIPNIDINTPEKKVDIKVYKTEEGYVMESTRKYVFESFNKMIEYINSRPDPKKKQH